MTTKQALQKIHEGIHSSEKKVRKAQDSMNNK